MLLTTSNQKGYLKLLLQNIKVYDFFSHLVPFRYSKSDGQFYPKTAKEMAGVKRKLVLYWILTVTGILQTLHLWHSLSAPDFSQCVFYVIFSMVDMSSVHDHLKNGRQVPAMLNSMMTWEKEKMKVYPNLLI